MHKDSIESAKIEYLEKMYNDLGPDILRFLARKVGPSASADLLQDTFVQALTHFDRLSTTISPKAWLMKVAYNLTCNHYRKQNKSFVELNEDFLSQETVDEDIRLEEVREIVKSLPDRNKEIVMLKWYNQLSYEEISHVLSIPQGTVRSRLHHSMKMIKDKLNLTRSAV